MSNLREKIIKELDEFNIDADDEFLSYGVEYVESFTGKSAISEELLIGIIFGEFKKTALKYSHNCYNFTIFNSMSFFI
ncbi:Uncharacterised protein [Clostridioides difficile]|nr:Uncharacterised protein [Clostridioides difficile]VHZ09375.1 Uncharacterised protein [Clostridioides difficile]